MRSRPILLSLASLLLGVLCLCGACSRVANGQSPSVSPSPAADERSLADKAQFCEEEIFAHYLQDGLLIPQQADPTGEARYSNDNAGYRTGCLLAAVANRWKVTQDPAARERARQVASALEMLETITGVAGMTCRQYKKMQGPGPDEAGWLQDYWHQKGEYRLLGNVSTDEMTWFLTGLDNYVLFCAEGEDRDRASATIARVVGRMLDHGMRIAEADGTTTDWGDCSLTSAREPLFCLHGLHYLKAASLCTSDPRFAEAYEQYASTAAYFDKAVHCFSIGIRTHRWAGYDYELASPGFELLIRFDDNQSRRDQFIQGLREMAEARRGKVFSHLCTAVLGLGGEDTVRDWLAAFDTNTDGVNLGWYLWIYWKARAAQIIGPND